MAQWVMPKKAAEITGVGVQTLRAWEKAGTIPAGAQAETQGNMTYQHIPKKQKSREE